MLCLQAAVMALAIGGGPGEPVLLEFSATWCGPCQRMEPVIRQLEAQGYPVRRVDFDRQRDLAARYGVQQVPTFVMLAGGREVDRHVGATDIRRLVAMYRKAQAAGRMEGAGRGATGKATGNTGAGTSPAVAAGGHARPATSSEVGASGPGAPEATAPSVSEDDLIAVSVRIRIEEPGGHSCGSGTIIDARQGEALILTCGHIFRESGGKGAVTVDLFGPTPATGIPGRVLWYDDNQPDIGLVAIRTPGPVVSARVAPADYGVHKGDRVYTVGCSHGQPPSVRRSRVTSLDRYVGPPNIQVAGLPVQGRSGGGLFSADGLVIGVCNAADPSENEGLYVGLPSVHRQLDAANLAFVYRRAGESDGSADLVQVPPSMPETMPESAEPAAEPAAALQARGAVPEPEARPGRRALTAEQQAALDQILHWAGQGAEVICVVRPLGDPAAPSEIITFNHASPEFLERLAAEAARVGRRRPSRSAEPTKPVPTGFHQARVDLATGPPNSGSTQPIPAAPPERSAWQPRWLDMAPSLERALRCK